MWNTFSVCLSRSAKSATKAISRALHTRIALKYLDSIVEIFFENILRLLKYFETYQ